MSEGVGATRSGSSTGSPSVATVARRSISSKSERYSEGSALSNEDSRARVNISRVLFSTGCFSDINIDSLASFRETPPETYSSSQDRVY